MSENPYAAPTTTVSDARGSEAADAEIVRQEHLSTEANLNTFGWLYLLGGAGALIGGVFVLFAGVSASSAEAELGVAIVMAAILIILGAAQFWVGSGLRAFKPAVRWPAIIFGFITLLNIGLGTILGLFILYVLFSAKGKRVLSEDYARIRELTPHMKYKTSILVWILLGIFVTGILAAILVPMLSG